MEYGKALKKAMIDAEIKDALALSKITGVSYNKVTRLLKSDGTCRLMDLFTVADYLDIKLTFKRNTES